MAKRPIELCPCGNPAEYDRCCGEFHRGQLPATAEQLMRSRYSAFVLGKLNYLRDTWHPDTRPTDLSLDDTAALRWLGLTVIAHHQTDESHASVEFVARSRIGGQPAVRHHEVSRFVRVDGRWLYLDGDVRGAT